MHYDDGFDLIAPPTPDAEHPPKLVDEHEHELLWVFPVAVVVVPVLFWGAFWLIFKALK